MSLNEHATGSAKNEFYFNAIYDTINYYVFARERRAVGRRKSDFGGGLYSVSQRFSKLFRLISWRTKSGRRSVASTTGVHVFPKHDLKNYVCFEEVSERFEITFRKNRNKFDLKPYAKLISF